MGSAPFVVESKGLGERGERKNLVEENKDNKDNIRTDIATGRGCPHKPCQFETVHPGSGWYQHYE